MDKPCIFIRADGGLEIGLGHLVRCIALAQMLKVKYKFEFVCKSIPEKFQEEITSQGFSVRIISSEEDFFGKLVPGTMVILDHYGMDSGYQQRIKSKESKLVVIDDLHDKEFFADIIINHSPGINSQNYNAQSYTKFALGLNYALLRPQFLHAAREVVTRNSNETVLICFGGSDFYNLTEKCLTAVIHYSQYKRVNVVLGAAYDNVEKIQEIAGNTTNVKIYHAVDAEVMLALMQDSDVAIVPSSGIVFEVIAAGCLPFITYYAENQKLLFAYLVEKKGFKFFNGIDFNEESFLKNLQQLEYRQEESYNQMRKEIGSSKENHLKNFEYLEEK
ncbi:UDP-2,4-diacetamido-2,4,6-trideoxy-beta-L-altropyranose hydrolase [Zunongwangia sp. F363]|uniref:UDP-2,4-diacetamido-2,4, 6-trideoxy-beta-L-altropyranose hydrolase n=1 Tax=Autumnicola tepida TaxID=3075595 RepID=A0ABU3CD84_9FLAO|nr:UDP-2,4-diacetamido-2,4,6-trideoxy-beta-L-altropyranose hydrolase [Zunongwangia sp. F363]MDT0644233.1 UDP-2,4-diacetamido-2,4,6-trideoxy-beta-L-altropyranose hydrolase [Zunongwangia sp. F363]